LTAGIVFLHAVEQGRAFERRLMAECNILVLGRQFEQALANRSQLSFGQLGQFINDFRRTHREKLMRKAAFVMQNISRALLEKRRSFVFAAPFAFWPQVSSRQAFGQVLQQTDSGLANLRKKK
jgi:hypothetical protein